MAKKNKSGIMVFLFLCSVGTMVLPFIASCGKSGTTLPAGSAVQFQVLNLSPDLQPVNLWVGYIKQNNYPYSYPAANGYITLGIIDTPIQVRSTSAAISTSNVLSFSTQLKANLKYTLFVTGFRADSSITHIFTIDTAAVSIVGRGKIRFVNASPRSPDLDVTANGTPAFTGQKYKGVSKFIEIPPGTYNFKIMPSVGSTTTVLSDLRNINIADGKIYTLYSYGIAGRVDSAAFGANVLINK